ncbi:MAG: alpha/beta hydrolase [Burkholderiaceae bacterium]
MPSSSPQTMQTERAFVPTRSGTIHIASAGEGFPVLLLHQTPRSWDEYRDVLPILGRDYRAIAMDTLGFGDSARLPEGEHSIERWAVGAFDLLDALGIARAAVVGHHTGAVVALEMAASQPDRVAALVLSSCPYIDAPRRLAHTGKRVIDDVQRRADGSHLTELWQRRAPFYPKDDMDLLERFMADAIKAGPLAVGGHKACNDYAMETRFARISSPTLLIAATDDPHAYPAAPRVHQAIPGSALVELQGGMVPLPDQMPEQFAQAVANFLKSVPQRS